MDIPKHSTLYASFKEARENRITQRINVVVIAVVSISAIAYLAYEILRTL